MAGVSAVFAELERELIAQRTAEALAELRYQGRVYGPIPFGYDGVDGQLVESPGRTGGARLHAGDAQRRDVLRSDR